MLKTGLKLAAIAAGVLGLSACAITIDTRSGESHDWRDNFSAERIRADVEFLADDAMRGRDADSAEYRVAANYVAAEFKRLGLKPAGENGSFFQEVPFLSSKLDIEQSFVELTVEGETHRLKLGQEAYIPSDNTELDASIEGEIVFAGYGIQSAKLGRDDLAGVDLEGKIALIIIGAPVQWNSEIRAHFRSSKSKAKAILDAGAKGILLMGSRTWNQRWKSGRYARSQKHSQLSWVPKGAGDGLNGRMEAHVSHAALAPLFAAAGTSIDAVMDAQEHDELESMALPGTVKMRRVSKAGARFTSPNVLAVLEGSDPKLKSEYVVTSAHLDHVGVDEDAKDGEDHIFNGAMDNATGVSVMMEVARNFAASGKRPKRSILFAAVTAEEKGLLGAEYFAHYPTLDEGKLVGNVNLDMPILLYDFADVIAFGADRSSLGPITEAAVTRAGVALSPDPLPEQGLFVRSDHYRFVQQGIPAVFLMTGFADTVDGENGGAVFREFLSSTYHTPADQPSLPIRYDVGAKFAYVNYLILEAIAESKRTPHWNEGDFFGETYAKSR